MQQVTSLHDMDIVFGSTISLIKKIHDDELKAF